MQTRPMWKGVTLPVLSWSRLDTMDHGCKSPNSTLPPDLSTVYLPPITVIIRKSRIRPCTLSESLAHFGVVNNLIL